MHTLNSFRILARTLHAIRPTTVIVTVFAAVISLAIREAQWPGPDPMRLVIEWSGVLLIVVCILGRAWCALYARGLEVGNFAPRGPYSVCRHPDYAFSIVGTAGFAAQFGSITFALTCAAIAWLIFCVVARRKEQSLTLAACEDYRNYIKQVPRFIPKPSLWWDVEKLDVQPSMVSKTLVNVSLLLIAIPIAEVFEYSHNNALWPH